MTPEMAEEKKIFGATLWSLGGIAALYFALMMVVNNYGATTAHVFSLHGGDEYIIYPYVLNMYSQDTLKGTLLSLMFYGDYTYGFPFYLYSFLSLLPIRLLAGEHFFNMYQTNLLWLRQFVSVLPMVLGAGLIVYLKTKFRHLWFSIFLFIGLLLLPAVVAQGVWFWHPDALAVLFIALALFFLDRDDFRLGHDFIIAAVWVGLASSTKMLGYWFVVLIAAYLLYAWWKKKVPFKRAALRALIFVLVMALVIVLTSPYLWFETHRARFLERFEFKAYELRTGYGHDDPYYYQRGPKYWTYTLRQWYMDWPYLLMLAGSMIFGLFIGRNRKLNWMIFGWTLPFLLYTLFLVAPKPHHYILPTLIFVFAAATDVPMWAIHAWRQGDGSWVRAALLALIFAVGLLFFYQLSETAQRSFAMYADKIDLGMRLVWDYCIN
ncbi:MAG: hypothetical protein JW750_04265 [Anaerolineaceae bacterium]|nr:hypothetical protein [Anaerolineaceae bacterium]